MASCRQSKSASNARRDIIGKLPVEIKDKILECLPTRDAARMALLSREWKDVWLRHGQLVFDNRLFFKYAQKYKGYKRMVNIIDCVLMNRAGLVKKFTLANSQSDLMLKQYDLDRWCLFLSENGVEELNIALAISGDKYFLPFCIVSCQTIRHLNLEGFIIGCPPNPPCMFPGITSLGFKNVEFKRNANGIVPSIPNLEKLAFQGSCRGINSFEISAPKLKSFSAVDIVYVFESRWLTFHLEAITTLCLSGLLLSRKPVAAAVPTFPTAVNLQAMKLYELSFGCGKQLTVATQLIQKSPNLCELGIAAEKSSWRDDKEAASRLKLLEDPDACFIIQDLKKLNTIKFECHSGSTLEMLFLKALLSKSPELEKVVIQKGCTMESDFSRELLCFLRASPKAQFVFKEAWWPHTLIGQPELYELSRGILNPQAVDSKNDPLSGAPSPNWPGF